MTNDPRSQAFIEPSTPKVGKLKLRGFSMGALNVARLMELTYIVGTEEEIASLTETERNRQIIAFAWAQSAPLDDVLSAVESGTWKRLVDRFEFSVDLETLPQMLTEINRVSRLAVASSVDIQDRAKAGSEGEQPPPN